MAMTVNRQQPHQPRCDLFAGGAGQDAAKPTESSSMQGAVPLAPANSSPLPSTPR